MPSSRFIFSRSRSVTSPRSREFSTWSSLKRVVCSIGEVLKPDAIPPTLNCRAIRV